MYTERDKAKQTKYRQSAKGKAKLKAYRQSPERKASQKKYKQSEKGKSRINSTTREYRRSAKCRQYVQEYRASGRAAANSRKYKTTGKGKLANLLHQRALVKKCREAVFDFYGQTCSRCGFSDRRALSIDHINGGGNEHRKKIKAAGTAFYVWLVRNKFPQGFQTLCMNCQFIKRHENHEAVKLAARARAIEEDLPLFKNARD
jgi:hypothetical protein